LDLRQQVRLLRAHLWVVLACALVGAGSAYVVSSRLPKVYEAKASLIAQNMATTFAEVGHSRPVLQAAITQLGLAMTPDALAANVDVKTSQTSALLTVTVHDPDPANAAAIATAIANALVQRAPEITGTSAQAGAQIQADLARVQADIDRIDAETKDLTAKTFLTPSEEAQLQSLRDQTATLLGVRTSLLNVSMSYSQSLVSVLSPAVAPTEPSSPKIVLNTGLGLVAGLVVGIGVVIGVGYLRGPAGREPVPAGGSPVAAVPAGAGRRRRSLGLAYLLLLLLGLIGAHRFYLGNGRGGRRFLAVALFGTGLAVEGLLGMLAWPGQLGIGVGLVLSGIGLVMLAGLLVFLVIDAVTLPAAVRTVNAAGAALGRPENAQPAG
jgi:capsular polysaccharide biosynthesis protein